MAYVPFVPLRIYSSYTMLDGAVEPKAFAKLAKRVTKLFARRAPRAYRPEAEAAPAE